MLVALSLVPSGCYTEHVILYECMIDHCSCEIKALLNIIL